MEAVIKRKFLNFKINVSYSEQLYLVTKSFSYVYQKNPKQIVLTIVFFCMCISFLLQIPQDRQSTVIFSNSEKNIENKKCQKTWKTFFTTQSKLLLILINYLIFNSGKRIFYVFHSTDEHFIAYKLQKDSVTRKPLFFVYH